VNRVDEELKLLQCDLSYTQVRNAEAEQQRQNHFALLRAKEAEREAQLAQEQAMNEAATRIQSAFRGSAIRRYVLPIALEERRRRQLEESRGQLQDSLLVLRRHLHCLKFEDEDRQKAAIIIQAWWQGILARRVVKVVLIRSKVVEVTGLLDLAAVRIQSVHRSNRAQKLRQSLQKEREARALQLQREEDARILRVVIKIQTALRGTLAVREASRRRLQLSWDLQTWADSGDRDLDVVLVPGAAEDGTDARSHAGGGGSAHTGHRSGGHHGHHSRRTGKPSPKSGPRKRSPSRHAAWQPGKHNL